MKTPMLETERLLLRAVQENDVNDIFNCWMQDEDVSRYMWWKASSDIAKTEDFVRFELEQIENEKWNRWILVTKVSREVIGTCLLYWNDEDEEPHWDVSYNLGKKYWGKGYTTEAMQKVMEYGCTVLHMTECATSYAKCNTASARVLQKLGFVAEKDIPFECSGGEIITDGVLCRFKVPLQKAIIIHKTPTGTVDLTFGGAATHIEKLEIIADFYSKYYGRAIEAVITGKSAALRIRVPILKMGTPFDVWNLKDLLSCFDAIAQMVEIAESIKAIKSFYEEWV